MTHLSRSESTRPAAALGGFGGGCAAKMGGFGGGSAVGFGGGGSAVGFGGGSAVGSSAYKIGSGFGGGACVSSSKDESTDMIPVKSSMSSEQSDLFENAAVKGISGQVSRKKAALRMKKIEA